MRQTLSVALPRVPVSEVWTCVDRLSIHSDTLATYTSNADAENPATSGTDFAKRLLSKPPEAASTSVNLMRSYFVFEECGYSLHWRRSC